MRSDALVKTHLWGWGLAGLGTGGAGDWRGWGGRPELSKKICPWVVSEVRAWLPSYCRIKLYRYSVRGPPQVRSAGERSAGERSSGEHS